MFGLIGGLLGGGRAFAARPAFRTPLGGLLAKRAMSGPLAARQSRPASVGGKPPEPAPKPEEVMSQPMSGEDQTPQAAPQSSQPAQPKPVIETASENLRAVDQQQKEVVQNPQEKIDSRPVTAGLLDEAPPVAEQPKNTAEKLPEAEQVVNQTDAATPVAKQADETFGNAPQPLLSGLADQIDEAPERRSFVMEDPNPTKPLALSQAKHTGNAPGYRFSSMGSWTSMTPTYSYRN